MTAAHIASLAQDLPALRALASALRMERIANANEANVALRAAEYAAAKAEWLRALRASK